MNAEPTKNPSKCAVQSGKAKSKKAKLVARITRLVRQEGLDYQGWRYEAHRVRRACDLKPAAKGRKLTRILTTQEFRRFYELVDQADNIQHALMPRLLFYTGVRVSELCRMEVADVDLEA